MTAEQCGVPLGNTRIHILTRLLLLYAGRLLTNAEDEENMW